MIRVACLDSFLKVKAYLTGAIARVFRRACKTMLAPWGFAAELDEAASKNEGHGNNRSSNNRLSDGTTDGTPPFYIRLPGEGVIASDRLIMNVRLNIWLS